MVNVSSREEARRLIESIIEDNGIVSRKNWEKLAALDKQLNDSFDKAFRSLLGVAGAAIITYDVFGFALSLCPCEAFSN